MKNGALALLGALTVGCGASALGAQADLVAIAGAAAADADAALVAARARELDAIVDEARTECGAAGCSEARAEEVRTRFAAAETRWAPALACRAPVVEALRAWAAGLETASAAGTPELGVALLLRLGARFVAEFRALERCVETAAPDVDLPGLPPGFLEGSP
jgi:hypothetical protein